MLLCRCLCAKRVLELYNNPKQFEFVAELNSHAEAQCAALDVLYDKAKELNLHRVWKSVKRKGPPATFILSENKMLKEVGEFQARVVFSYYRYPLRYYGRLVGRYLTLPLKTWKAVVPGIKMLNTTFLLRFVRRWNDWL